MKKLVLGGIAVTMCFALTACGTSQSDAALTRLGNQLDETANTISSIQTVNPSDISLTKETLEKISTTENPLPHFFNARAAQNSLLNEQYYKTSILEKTSSIKNNISKDLKLSKAQISAIKDLTESLGKYTNSISYSKNEMESATKAIASLKKNADKNSSRINAKLNRLACNSNARSAYFQNLLSALSEIESYVCPECEESYSLYVKMPAQNEQEESYSFYIKAPSHENLEQSDNTETLENTEESKSSIKNIDTYLSTEEANADEENETDCNDCKNCPECVSSTYPIHGQRYANPYMYQNFGNAAYNRSQTFNPDRNTDTYGPTLRNIDTYNSGYAWGANGMYGANGIYNPSAAYSANGFYGNCIYGSYPAFYGNKRFYNQGHPAAPYYNSNTMNRLAYPQAQPLAFASTDAQEIEKDKVSKIDNAADEILEKSPQTNTANQTAKSAQLATKNTEENAEHNNNSLANTPKTLEYIAENEANSAIEVSNQSEIDENKISQENESANHDKEVMPLPEPPITPDRDLSSNNLKSINKKSIDKPQITSSKIRKIDNKTAEKDEADQVVVAHSLTPDLCLFDINSKIAKLMK